MSIYRILLLSMDANFTFDDETMASIERIAERLRCIGPDGGDLGDAIADVMRDQD